MNHPTTRKQNLTGSSIARDFGDDSHFAAVISREMLKLFAIISLLFLHLLVPTQATGKCRFNEKHFNNFTLEVINNTIYLDMVMPRTINRGLKVLIDFQISLDKRKSYQRLFAYILDVCAVVSSVKSSMFKSWFLSVLEHGNFMANCPVPAGHYFLRNWKLDSNLVPHYMIAGDYRVFAHFFYGKHKTRHEDFVLDMDIYAVMKAA
ncbi:uncharacterized protein LOC111072271 [Drosophila obscura]|uniref:uncharacterized protein LOC111072271 n=1 Tax=Drosophila obscura TaxID=7282 RepID=UPI001BB23AA3|nr:uncharacterized protein LOC111072271 [Drosophila obscura]